MAEEIKEFTINPAEIRTMQKDIARLQREGPPAKEEVAVLESKVFPPPVEAPPLPAPPAPAETEKKRKEEARKRAEEERQRIEREQKSKEETLRKTEEERTKKEEEERKIELRKRIEEEREQRIEALRQAEEQRKRIIEQEKEQEQRAIVEIRREAQARAKKERIDPRLLKEKKIEIKKQIRAFQVKKRPLEQKRTSLFSQKAGLEKTLKPILAEERRVEDKIKAIEKREKSAKSLQERQTLEKNRWRLEAERKEIEAQRWEKEKQIQEIDLGIKEISFKIEELLDEIKELKQLVAKITKKQNRIKLEKERVKTEKELKELQANEIQPLQSEKTNLVQKLNEKEKRLVQASNQEIEIEKQKEILEQKESLARSLEEKREIEKQRWDVEEKRKRAEIKRWRIEKEKEQLELQIKAVDLKLSHVLKKEENLKKKIEEIDRFLAGIPEKKIKPGPPPRIREPIPKAEPIPPIPAKAPPQEPIKEPIKEKLKELRLRREKFEAEEREEKLKKVAALKERLLKIQQKEEQERKDFLEKIKAQEKEGVPLKSPELPKIVGSAKKEIVFRPLPEKLSTGEKLWIRLVILFSALIILGGVITFWYWYVNIRSAKGPAGPGGVVPIEQPLVIPTALIEVESLPILEASSSNEVPALIFQTINAEFQKEQVFRILIKNEDLNAIIGLGEFLTAFNVETPETFYEKLNNDFTLFVHSASIGNRLGFVTLIENEENLANLLTSWEASIEDDTAELFVALGKQEKALLPYFKSGWYQGISFRCQPFSRQDLGICWSIMDDKFVFTTSWNTMEKVIDIIKTE